MNYELLIISFFIFSKNCGYTTNNFLLFLRIMTKIETQKLHTTELGKERILRNIGLTIEEVLVWCVQENYTAIEQRGKNWYVYSNDFALTINVKSHTIITAHKRKNYERLT